MQQCVRGNALFDCAICQIQLNFQFNFHLIPSAAHRTLEENIASWSSGGALHCVPSVMRHAAVFPWHRQGELCGLSDPTQLRVI